MSQFKIKCKCGKIATWLYMPGYGNDSHPFHCDDCVPRGCSCNWENIKHDPVEDPEGIEGKDWKWVTKEIQREHGVSNPEEKVFWVYIDENGKESPCCEYDYDEKGYNIKDFEDE